MNLLMITLLTVGGVVGKGPADVEEPSYAEEYYGDYGHGRGHVGLAGHLHNKHAIHNTSPQTCYDPRYGCYHSNGRHMNRYPAFHGTFYRQAYNYRNYFEYPWHAQPHEPTSLFSYNVGEDQPGAAESAPMPPSPPQARRVTPAPQPTAPTPATSPRPAPTTRAAVTPQPTAIPVGTGMPMSTARQIAIPVFLPSSEYTAPPPASLRISSGASPAVQPASAVEPATSRRLNHGNEVNR